MSSALLRQSLELFGYTSEDKKKKKGKKNQNSDTTLSRLTLEKNPIVSKPGLRNKKLTVYKAKQYLELETDPVQENVNRLLQLSNDKNTDEKTKKIIKRVALKQLKYKKEKATKTENRTVLTEEDIKMIADNFDSLN